MGSYDHQQKGDGPLDPRDIPALTIKPGRTPQVTSFVNTFIPPYFWAETPAKLQEHKKLYPTHRGYSEARSLIGDGKLETLDHLTNEAQKYISTVFEELQDFPSGSPSPNLVELRLSDDLQKWRNEQIAAGRVLPCKGEGISKASPEVIQWFGAEEWPEPLLTTGGLFGCGMANMLIGGHDPRTLYSNYCTDMVFYYEHSYHKVFPEFEELIKTYGRDPHALNTLGGKERRAGVDIGMRYIRGKIDLEVKNKHKVANKAARLDRRTAQTVFFSESSLMGMSAESIARGFDPAGVMSDMIFSSPGTDVVDVGSDLNNSELMNAFLNTDDIASTGIVTEEALRRVYDAYAHTGGRMFIERWMEPAARMCATLYTWHIQNDRHSFCRRALLGYPKARKTPTEQREGDFDEVFDEKLHTTGFSRPLQNACNGGDPCDAVERLVGGHEHKDILAELWRSLATAPLEYVRGGVVDQGREEKVASDLREMMAKAFHYGLILEMTWLTAHAGHHAWQVNHLFEAAMWGSLLDDGGLQGKLDRKDY